MRCVWSDLLCFYKRMLSGPSGTGQLCRQTQWRTSIPSDCRMPCWLGPHSCNNRKANLLTRYNRAPQLRKDETLRNGSIPRLLESHGVSRTYTAYLPPLTSPSQTTDTTTRALGTRSPATKQTSTRTPPTHKALHSAPRLRSTTTSTWRTSHHTR